MEKIKKRIYSIKEIKYSINIKIAILPRLLMGLDKIFNYLVKDMLMLNFKNINKTSK
jgi:hypothetical protein